MEKALKDLAHFQRLNIAHRQLWSRGLLAAAEQRVERARAAQAQARAIAKRVGTTGRSIGRAQ